MNKNKKTLTILAVGISLLCVIAGLATVVYKPSLTNDVIKDESSTSSENTPVIDPILAEADKQLGLKGQIEVGSFSVNSVKVPHQVRFKDKLYGNVELFEVVWSEQYLDHYTEGCYDVVFVLFDHDQNQVLTSLAQKCKGNQDACQVYMGTVTLLNLEKEEHGLSFMIKPITSCMAGGDGGSSEEYSFYILEQDRIAEIGSEIEHSTFSTTGAGCERQTSRSEISISTIPNKSNKYNDLLFSITRNNETTMSPFLMDADYSESYSMFEPLSTVQILMERDNDFPCIGCQFNEQSYTNLYSYVNGKYVLIKSTEPEIIEDCTEMNTLRKNEVDRLVSKISNRPQGDIQYDAVTKNEEGMGNNVLYVIPFERKELLLDDNYFIVYDFLYVLVDKQTESIKMNKTDLETFKFIHLKKWDVKPIKIDRTVLKEFTYNIVGNIEVQGFSIRYFFFSDQEDSVLTEYAVYESAFGFSLNYSNLEQLYDKNIYIAGRRCEVEESGQYAYACRGFVSSKTNVDLGGRTTGMTFTVKDSVTISDSQLSNVTTLRKAKLEVTKVGFNFVKQ
ncbi:hypothetical protein HMPREF9711_01870 [Myroides odoratimimus CCUG 3837]|uniref:hypothetical protein n=1 Tax=Myroides odoratimimus TaxID=76832 RepID=UPI000280AA56|nr:hypothetical protein [Myroides odoratimimus]EKB04541.1 hypothetical protein HMPREF9711_01870 [Myroides odoratimimus CCUG 3837]